ncbi:hypothetical protein MBTS_09945, partial [Methylobacterium bullatum]|uniref:hypothetical protein n=1 Tax=Methylobacterium bullatum TaxID=570505 RepID=UPI001AED5F0A
GGGGGGGSLDRAFVDEKVRETLGSGILDFMAGFPVGSLAEGYDQNGGGDARLRSILSDAFGADFSGFMSARSGEAGEMFRTAVTQH